MGRRLGAQKMETGNAMKVYILDTSVIVKWFSEYKEDGLDESLRLRNDILEGKSSAIVPALMFYELANALRYNPRFNADDVKTAVHSVMEMGLDVKGIDAEIMTRAVEIAFRFHATVYDTYFLALSQTENRPLVTADYRFFERMKGFRNLLRLSDFAV